MRNFTPVLLLVVSVALWFYDDWMAWTGNGVRISGLCRLITAHAPVTSLLFVFWAGIVVGHLFLPQVALQSEEP